ncbi:isoleucine--tRNA ligase [Dokdonella sp.]|uniref:isoleucine--tRNA ligase n=2 Tax=Dokdonella sp. TaxID=2291710 RepID=UPI002CE7CC4C|nr:isoleucine--tRNA ligase [Dokdonella sp.]HOX72180.1 isoleucine--tRNA ligase [Dokdonella sp.]HPN79503.1 isoleucine--tRNA ligase [Dokdonella sp.]
MSKDYKNTINLPKTEFAMKANLSAREPAILADWHARDRYAEIQKRTATREHAFILHDGPPYANGVIHIGHAVNKVLKDIVVKSKLMAGFRSPYVPGWDCHGLPIEIAVEKEFGKVGQKLDAAEFRQKCREYAAKQIDLQRADFKRLGVLGDWDRPYRTMDAKFEAEMLRALAKIYANGHITRGFKPVHWCFDCGSALAEAEIEYADKVSPAVDVAYDAIDAKALAAKFGVDINDDTIVAVPIWTTTPWTLPASLAVSLGSDLEYSLVRGPMRNGRSVLLVIATLLRDACAVRYQSADDNGAAVTFPRSIRGSELEGVTLRHPFYEREIPILLGDHVTAEDGTGAVHTAPGHGVEDFTVSRLYGLIEKYSASELNPVGGNGVYLPGTPIVEGQFIWKANDSITELLRGNGHLLAHAKFEHSYPHCWRHKTPVAFRATPQWFMSMEKEGLRATALKSIKDVRWIPSWGEERITGMIAGRPDWCISRQRTWGVPIALFVDKTTQLPHPRSEELFEQVAQRVEKDGIDAWSALDARDLLADDAERYEKVSDVLDVWFDSGVTHFAVLDQRDELARKPGDKVMYLEGSDQHRGWFHSSLLTSSAMHGRAPYDEVLTHGFAVDQNGRKMSKSLGNVVAPQKVVDSLGADVLRLWVASTDYRNEMTVSDEILKRVSDAYRRIRNTARFLLGNLDGFDPAKHLIPVEQGVLLDQWAVQQAHDVQTAVVAAYERYDFPEIVQRVQNFCTNEMGSLYLDITKDRLYTMPTDSLGRRSAQSAMFRILEALVRWLAPITSFTAEEIWPLLPGVRGESVMFETWYDGLAAGQCSAGQRKSWNELLAIRATVSKVLEGMRAAGSIGASLQADVSIHLAADMRARHAEVAGELRFFFITSELRLADVADRPEGAIRVEGHDAWVVATPSEHAKCVRCWHYRSDVGSHADDPELCGRCVENVEGQGETRLWF